MRRYLISVFAIVLISVWIRANAPHCIPIISEDCIDILFPDPASLSTGNSPICIVALKRDFNGSIKLLNGQEGLLNSHREEDIESAYLFSDSDTIPLTSLQATDRAIHLFSEKRLVSGQWRIKLPKQMFEIRPDFVEVDSIDLPESQLMNLAIPGAWHKKGYGWPGRPMITFHDDDGMDGSIPSSSPSDWMSTGYYSILYPMLESLGYRGCVSLEGRRAGWTAGKSNENAEILRRLQDERGWEIQSHSMLCLGETLKNWMVDGIDSQLAKELLKTGDNNGPFSSVSVSVYDSSSGIQYMPLLDGSAWVPADSVRIRPYVGDYKSGEAIMYNDGFSIDYHWGEWFRQAEKHGINGKSWVTHNTSSSHANVPKINAICPNGFADVRERLINTPPLLSTACRMMLEGQVVNDKKWNDEDNSYNKKHFEFFKQRIDETASCGGWLVVGLHAYRKCWSNYRKGALVSEGGDYPDAWVYPMDATDPLHDPLTPSARLGIKDWSEWYPCPGTRLRMVWDLLKYAKEVGLLNVTSSEGFEIIGNKIGVGYYNEGLKIGQDRLEILGTSERYPHYIVGANGEVSYYMPLLNNDMETEVDIQYADWYEVPGCNIVGYFDTYGRKLPGIQPDGITIIKTDDGSSRKIIK